MSSEIIPNPSYLGGIKALQLRLNEAVDRHHKEYELSRASGCITWHQILGLARSLDQRYVLLGGIEGAENRLALYQEALDILPPRLDDDLGPTLSTRLAEAMIDLGFSFADASKSRTPRLEESITLCRRTVSALEEGHEEYPEVLRVLGIGLIRRSLALSDDTDLAKAIRLLNFAYSPQFYNHTLRSRFLYALGTSYLYRSDFSWNSDDLKTTSQIFKDILPFYRHPTIDCLAVLQSAGDTFAKYGWAIGNPTPLQGALSLPERTVDIRDVLQLSSTKALCDLIEGYNFFR
jgi:hypothetical protein